jgi:hypothetical protein
MVYEYTTNNHRAYYLINAIYGSGKENCNQKRKLAAIEINASIKQRFIVTYIYYI